jgi:DegV family protein with EDD domain
MVHIFTDSTSDIGEFATKHNIGVIPLSVTIGGKNYTDGVDIRAKQIFDLVAQVGELPKTAAPSAGEFQKAFEAVDGECFYVGISSKLSASFQNARVAAEALPPGKVHLVDSLNLSTGAGILAIRAALWRDQGLSAAEIAKKVQADVAKGRLSFLIDTMEYLYKGGRCTALQAVMGSVLKIHPIIMIDDKGAMVVKEKARGARRKGLQMMVDDFAAHAREADLRYVGVPHTGCDEDAEWLKAEILKVAPVENVIVAQTGAVVCSHGGPNTMGLAYFMK